MEALVKFVQDEFVTRKDLPEFSAGDTITVFAIMMALSTN